MASGETLPPPVDRRRRILIVDGGCWDGSALISVFEHEGYDAEVVGDYEDALELARVRLPDLIVVLFGNDPGQAFELSGSLRMRDDMRLTPIVLVSMGETAAEDLVVRGLLSGADDCVVLPGRVLELAARVRVQLRNRRDRELLQWAESQRQRFKDAALCDALTGLANRRVADRRVIEGLEARVPLTLLIFDVDHFKRINDTVGHATGDVVLQQIAQALDRRARKEDIVARYGGEEFVAVVRHARPAVAFAIAERYRKAVAEIALDPALGVGRVTISVGVASWSGKGDPPTMEQMFAEADRALYDAKRAGRDRVCVNYMDPGPVSSSPIPITEVTHSSLPPAPSDPFKTKETVS